MSFNSAELVEKYRIYHQIWIRVWAVCVVGIIIMSCWLGYIGASPSKYDNYEDNWESCIFQPNYVYVPTLTPFGVVSKPTDVGGFGNALVFVGLMVIGMTLAGNCALYWAWSDTRWSLSAACFGFWCTFMVFAKQIINMISCVC